MPLDDTGWAETARRLSAMAADEDWAVTWRIQGRREIAAMPDEFSARQFGQICALLTDVDDVHVLPPIGPIDIQVSLAA